MRFASIGSLALVAALASGCGADDPSRPGSPRTARTPLDDAPLPYAESPEDLGVSSAALGLFKERLYSRVVARHVVGAEILAILRQTGKGCKIIDQIIHGANRAEHLHRDPFVIRIISQFTF